LDNVVSRLGFVTTRLSGRQAVSHGHIAVNKKRVSIPSYKVSIGDVISIMPRSQKSKLFEGVAERAKGQFVPQWLTFDLEKLEGKVVGTPKFIQSENAFEMSTILDFYKR
jgi:small subunit ribosomal protein S4